MDYWCARVKPIRNPDGLVTDYATEGEFPKFGNNDPRVDDIAVDLVKRFMDLLRSHATYRGAIHTQSVLTITSNVVYGKGTGNTPDGRRLGEPFGPGNSPTRSGWPPVFTSRARPPRLVTSSTAAAAAHSPTWMRQCHA